MGDNPGGYHVLVLADVSQFFYLFAPWGFVSSIGSKNGILVSTRKIDRKIISGGQKKGVSLSLLIRRYV